LAVLAFADSAPELTTEQLEQNRKEVERLARESPLQYAQLKKARKEFQQLSPERQERLRKLDFAWDSLEEKERRRLARTLGRYHSWLDRLAQESPEDFRALQQAGDPQKRLALLYEMRFIRRLPRAERDKYAQAKARGQEQQALEELRKKAREFRDRWRMHVPVGMHELPDEIMTFVREYLRPRVPGKDFARLNQPEFQGPLFMPTLVKLADEHPLALPGTDGPRNWQNLPAEVRKKLHARGGGPKRQPPPQLPKRDRWPEYGSDVVAFARKNGVRLPMELWPAEERDLSPPVRRLVEGLGRNLTDEEKQELDRARGHWPAFPVPTDKLARVHKLEVPWQTLPGQREDWDLFRVRKKSDGVAAADNPGAKPPREGIPLELLMWDATGKWR